MIHKVLNSIVYGCASIIGFIVFLISIFYVNNANLSYSQYSITDYAKPLYLIGLSLSTFLIILAFTKKLRNVTLKKRITLYLLFISILLIFQIIVSTHVFGASGIDDFDVRIQATKLSFGNNYWAQYFTEWAPQNVGTTIFFSWLLKIGYHIVGIQHATIFVNIVIMCLIDLALFCGWLTTKLFDQHANIIHPQDVFFCFAILFCPVYLTALIMYTDPLSLCAVTFSIYCFCRYISNTNHRLKHYLWIIFSGFFAMLASYLKMNAIILLIAIIIAIIQRSKKTFVQKLAIILILAITFLITNCGVKSLNAANNFQPNEENGWPATYWIAMGLNKDSEGTSKGAYNYPASLPSKKARTRYENKKIKEELKNTSPQQFLNLFWNKINITWSRGTMGLEDRSYSITPYTDFYYNYIMGSSHAWIHNESQIIYILIWLGFLVNSFLHLINRRGSDYDQVISLFIIGIFLFHTFMWEVMARYAYLVAIPLMIEGSLGLTYLFNWLDIRKVSLHLKYWPILSILVITFGAFSNYTLMSQNTSMYENIVVGQDFLKTNSLNIKPHKSIHEKIIAPNSFNRVQLTNTGIVNNSNFLIHIKNSKGKLVKISAFKPNKYRGDPGQYYLSIRNVTNTEQTINVLTLPKMDLLQPMSNFKNTYLSFKFTNVGKSPLISHKLYWISYFLVLLCLLYILIRSFTYQDVF